jgi:hypothetical protein
VLWNQWRISNHWCEGILYSYLSTVCLFHWFYSFAFGTYWMNWLQGGISSDCLLQVLVWFHSRVHKNREDCCSAFYCIWTHTHLCFLCIISPYFDSLVFPIAHQTPTHIGCSILWKLDTWGNYWFSICITYHQ